ncbi:sugar ABC transporter substrate-binding protein [Candidatus Pristimantibacillus sp. PTI5]|uniref:sugar ABC transporter substrate-binding protein n=1 Tax=Candidatus Pristimantibacillus sp. PTI5 TaxID=3400422 RepID=UPI003B01712D
MLNKSAAIFIVASLILITACSRPDTHFSDSIEEKDGYLPFGKYKQPVTLSVGMGVDPNFKSYTGETPSNSPWVKAIKDTLNINVKIDWMVTNQNMEQKMDLAITSNTLPDAMVVSQFQLDQMVKADELAELTEAYHHYASPVMKRIIDSTDGVAMEHVTFNGKMLALPSVYAEDISMMWIRKDWLDRLGLQPPSSMDELEQTALAFVEKDPDGNGRADTVGIATGNSLYDDFNAGPESFNLNPVFSAYNAYPGFWLRGTDGKPVYGSIQPEMKAALGKLREMYAEGLIDQEMGIRESAAEVVIEGKAGIFFAPFFGGYWPVPEALKNNPRANWQAYALPLNADGKFNAKVFKPTKSFVVVRKGYEHPEAVIKTVNLILRDEYKYGKDFQPLRNALSPRDEISFSVKALNAVLSGDRKPEDFAGKVEYSLLYNDLNTIKNTKLAPYDNTDIQYWNTRDNNFKRAYSLLIGGRNLLDPKLNKVKSVYYSHTDTMETEWRHLLDTEMDLFTQIIMGVAPLVAFDQWVSDWKRQGGEKITQEVANTINQ